jgi:hypothetical protein
VRLGWTAVPRELAFDDGPPVSKDWSRVMSILLNGASNIAQYGALAALDDEGLAEMRRTVGYYMENARIIKESLTGLGLEKLRRGELALRVGRISRTQVVGRIHRNTGKSAPRHHARIRLRAFGGRVHPLQRVRAPRRRGRGGE